MRVRLRVVGRGCLVLVLGWSLSHVVHAEQPPATEEETTNQWWIKPLPVPFDPELEALITEVQEGLTTIHTQMVRRKENLKKTQDQAVRATLYDELERLRKQRDEMEALLHQLVEEAMVSERTAIDEALARARWLERQQEYQEQKEELLRDRQP